jgi:hypothetical protein
MTTIAQTKEAIQALLMTNDRAVERALYRIYQRQTASEQATESTNQDNGVGFTGADAPFLTSCAKGMIRYGHLTPKQLIFVRKKIVKYWKQLAEVAEQQGRKIAPIQTVAEVDMKCVQTRAPEVAQVNPVARTMMEATQQPMNGPNCDHQLSERQFDLLIQQAEQREEDARMAHKFGGKHY